MTTVRIIIKLRKEILDPEGAAVAAAIQRNGLGKPDVCRVGKVVELKLAGSKEEIEARVHEICDKVLVNPVMQDYEIEWL